ncbi:MAG TPA: sigma-70 family RNA polymerase sigma factor [Gemmataceae bacterium]|nr:sigma-70 family RNA polymerase sigma factor [Gemmataceae bacterium]
MDHLRSALRRFLADEPYRRLTDDELWARFRDHREEGAFRVFLEKTGGIVYALSRSVLRNDAEAEEAFQETFCALFRHRAKLGSYPAAVAWLIETAKNQARMHRRWRLRLTRREHRKAEASPTAAVETECSLTEREQREAVVAALAGLPKRERRAVELVYLAGMSYPEAAAALGWSRGTVGTYVRRGLERLRRAPGLREGTTAAILTTVLTDVPALPPERLIAHFERVWARAGAATESAGVWWLAGRPRLIAGLTVSAGLAAVAGLTVWPRPTAEPLLPPAPVVAAPVADPETLHTKNLRILKAEVLPRVVAEVGKLGYTPPDVTWGDNNESRVFGSRAFIPLVPSRKVPTAPEIIHLEYCTLQRQLWGHTFEQNRWMMIRPESPLMYDIWIPRSGLIEVRFPESAKSWRALEEAFGRIPREERTERELVQWAFGPGGWTGEEFTVTNAATWAGVAGNGRDLFAADGREVFVRRGPGGWRYLCGKHHRIGSCLAATETHLYGWNFRSIVRVPIDDPNATPETICDAQPGELRSIAVTDDTIYVSTGKPGEWFDRPLNDPKAKWVRHEFTTAPIRFAAAGQLVFFADDKAVSRRHGTGPNAQWTRLVRVPTPSPLLAVWGDRLLAIPQEPGPIHARPLSAGPDVGWEVIGRISAGS